MWRNGVKANLGAFDTPEEAYEVYCQNAAQTFGPFANFGKEKSTYHLQGRSRKKAEPINTRSEPMNIEPNACAAAGIPTERSEL